MDWYARAEAAAAALAEATGVEQHDVAVVLGSGWGAAADALGEPVAELPVASLPRTSCTLRPNGTIDAPAAKTKGERPMPQRK